MSDRTMTNLVSLVVVLLACTQIIGFFAGWRSVQLYAKAAMIAPLPVPFNAVRGYESLRTLRSYEVTFADGSAQSADLDAYLAEQLHGPHTRKIPYLQILRMAPRVPRPVVDSVLEFTFCRGTGADYLSTLPNVSRLTITLYNGEEMWGGEKWVYPVTCS